MKKYLNLKTCLNRIYNNGKWTFFKLNKKFVVTKKKQNYLQIKYLF